MAEAQVNSSLMFVTQFAFKPSGTGCHYYVKERDSKKTDIEDKFLPHLIIPCISRGIMA